MDSGESAKRVDSDPDGILMKQAIAEHHNNLNIYSATKDAPFIDDPIASTGRSLLEISIPGTAATLRKSQVPMLIYASWYDAGTVQGTIQRFREFSNLQSVFIGAWSHGANSNADPFLPLSKVQPSRQQQWLEALQFFNRYLKDVPKQEYSGRQLSYYTLGKNEWQSTEVWPPTGLRKVTYKLNANGTLNPQKSGGSLRVTLQITRLCQPSPWESSSSSCWSEWSDLCREHRRRWSR